jgi:hypothetical protein
MILPTKHVSLDKSLLGAGACVLSILSEPMTPTGIWEKAKHAAEIGTYGRFLLTLDFLYAIRAIDLADGLIVRNERS